MKYMKLSNKFGCVLQEVNSTRVSWDDREANFGAQLPTDDNMEVCCSWSI